MIGEEKYRGRGVFYCAKCDGPLYQGETIAVVGGGDHALIDTQFLTRLTDRVILIDAEPEFSAGREYREAVRAVDTVEILQETEVREILGEDGLLTGLRVADTDGSNERSIDVGGLYVHIDIDPNSGFLDGTVPLSDDGRVLVGADMQTEVKGIYAAGDVRVYSPRTVSAAVGDGMVAIESIRRSLE